MTPSSEMLALARQGDPHVIAAIINSSIQRHGITAKVARQNACLHVLLESNRQLNKQTTVDFIRNGLKTLNIEPIKMIKVYGRRTGENSVAWNQEIQLNTDTPPIDLSLSTPPSQNLISPVTQLSSSTPVIPPNSDIDAVAPNSGRFDVPEAAFEPDSQNLLLRPESVILIIFVTVILLWQLYLDFLETDEAALSGRQLAERLGINQSTISRRKIRPDFSDWTQSLDPEGIAWVYTKGMFRPQTGLPDPWVQDSIE